MKAKLLFLLLISTLCYSQNYKQITNFDNIEDSLIVNIETEENVFTCKDNYDDQLEGDGCLEITTKFRVYPNDWGTYTEAIYSLPHKMDLSEFDEIRFWVKIVERANTQSSMQWTCALGEMPEGASGKEVWQWDGDQDMLYNVQDDWFEVVIPFNRLVIPEWMTTVDGVFDPSSIVSFEFGVQGDSTAVDSIKFLIDDLRATKSTVYSNLFGFESNENSEWNVWIDDELNKFELKDNYDDPFEGDACLEVNCALRHFKEENLNDGWGTANEAHYTFPQKVDLTGASEIRFYINILKAPENAKSIQMSTALYEKVDSSAEENWVTIDKYGWFETYTRTEGWTQIVVPIKEFFIPEWVTPVNGQLDLNSITGWSFTVGGDDRAIVDSVQFLMDNLFATNMTGETGVNGVHNFKDLPREFALKQNYPNPFNPTTQIEFTIPETGFVNLKIYNSLGQLVKTVIDNRYKLRGNYKYSIDMSELSSGVYFYKLSQNNRSITKKMMLLK